ncbi:MFS transporter [Saccharopolyspora erythraea]|uniref:MFS transporter n=1 Tax=Saccharopolyspora erythraea TaxID=1836 RepID=UPI001BAC4C5F|nr:MFS transporter [Saccharopolyspora erythraea]QUH03388.1 MFS transporter [Saccharopolyspora erythraea]
MKLDAIEDAPVSGFHRKLLVACCGGPLLDGYLLSIIGVALVGITDEMRLSTTSSALVGVVALVGMFLGGLTIGPLTDRLGRRSMYTIDLAVLLVASVLCVFVTEAWQLVVLRFVVGFAVGADYPIATALLAEWFPRAQRARALGGVIVAWYLGALLSYVVGFAITEVAGPGGWRWVLGSAAVVSAVVLVLRHGTPESPRWLVDQGRAEEAATLVHRVLRVPVTADDLIASRERAAVERGGLRELFRGIYLRRALFVSVFYTCQVIPMWAMYLFGPQMLAAFGLDSQNLSNLGSALISALFLLGCVPAMRLLETAGRRRTIIWSFALMAVPLAVLGWWPAAPVAAVIVCFSLYAFFAGAPGILEWLYPNELFPTSIRASAVGLAVALSRIGAAVGTYLVPLSLESLGTSATMYIGTAITLVGLLACVLWAEETKGLSLAQASGGEVPERKDQASAV